jgi:hypothetical protein
MRIGGRWVTKTDRKNKSKKYSSHLFFFWVFLAFSLLVIILVEC